MTVTPGLFAYKYLMALPCGKWQIVNRRTVVIRWHCIREKKRLLEQKIICMIDSLTLVPTDTVPMVNMAWES